MVVLKDLMKGGLKWLFTVQAALNQDKTNGKSPLGTFGAAKLPQFLNNNPLPNGVPWGPLTADGTNYYKQWPNTGVTRKYDFTVSRGVIAPDGYERKVLLVNGAFPGPTIESNWGDWIEVTVHNNITDGPEGAALHWHGFRQQGTQWEDGVPSVSQCPIAPGKTYTYRFQATLYGTSWYHSHYSAQYAGGLFGPIVVYGPCKSKQEVDLGPVILSDWYHKQYFDIIEDILQVNGSGLAFSDNNLINGKNNFNCSTVAAGDNTKCTNNAGISKFKFQTGKTHRLRLINAGAEGTQRFSIDGHTMTVIANDFVQVEPYDTKVVTLGIGQRTDVLIKANAGDSRSAFWMRSNLTTCSLATQPYALAAVYYDQADENKTPTSNAWNVPDPGTCTNDDLSLTKPVMKLKPANPAVVKTMEIKVFRNASGIVQWSLDGEDFRGDFNSPTLLQANKGNLTFANDWNVDNFANNGSIRVVVSNNSPASHPMHLHGFNMYILHEGDGLTWDGTITNPENPQRRDVQQVRANGHMVMQFDSIENPGIWPFHCHIAWHVSAGLFSQFLVQPDKVRQFQIPSKVDQVCKDWSEWTRSNIPDVIDSGL
ncbi:Laccase-2-like protein 1 [Colletotrichum musicola]|uniref:Laccase-2-like protein 1 n=2 Tax=Colletotrichum orchidearum species complex TaxID=2707337 RepID=A0A8H6J1V3_9PEZI|nr:Laccase-2-like protein 1 [Colletotrichum musicola]KAF6823179.1 Laccase-2-like protein 1 [Colletotrichum plurivorum]